MDNGPKLLCYAVNRGQYTFKKGQKRAYMSPLEVKSEGRWPECAKMTLKMTTFWGFCQDLKSGKDLGFGTQKSVKKRYVSRNTQK